MIVFAWVANLAAEDPTMVLGSLPLLTITITMPTPVLVLVCRGAVLLPSPAPRPVPPVCAIPTTVSRPAPRSVLVVPTVPVAVTVAIVMLTFPRTNGRGADVGVSAEAARATLVAAAVGYMAAPAVVVRALIVPAAGTAATRRRLPLPGVVPPMPAAVHGVGKNKVQNKQSFTSLPPSRSPVPPARIIATSAVDSPLPPPPRPRFFPSPVLS